VTTQALFSQLLIGAINGAFYALLSLGLSVIFGLLNIINFAHGALYMMGAFVAYFLLQWAGLGYWSALLIAPIVVGLFGIVIEEVGLQQVVELAPRPSGAPTFEGRDVFAPAAAARCEIPLSCPMKIELSSTAAR